MFVNHEAKSRLTFVKEFLRTKEQGRTVIAVLDFDEETLVFTVVNYVKWEFENYTSKYALKFKLYLFYDYETSSTTYINHARWHRYLRSDGLRVGGNRSTRRKPTCPDLVTTWPSHMPTPGIEPESQRCVNTAPTRQPLRYTENWKSVINKHCSSASFL